MTELTASPNRPEGTIGPSMRKTLSFSFISDRVNHKCLSAATRADMDRPMARAVSLVAWRAKSAVLLSSEIISLPGSEARRVRESRLSARRETPPAFLTVLAPLPPRRSSSCTRGVRSWIWWREWRRPSPYLLPHLPAQADHTQTVCIPARDVMWAGRNTQSITQSAFALVCLSTCFRHALRC